MAALKLSREQAELAAKELSHRVLTKMEESGGAWADAGPRDVLAIWDETAPMVAAIRELSEDQQTENLDLLMDIAIEARSNHQDSAGYELIIQRQIEGGAVVEHLVSDDESAGDAIERSKRSRGLSVELAYIALSIVEAVERAQDEAKANAGDPGAKERLATKERWAAENRKLAAEAVSA